MNGLHRNLFHLVWIAALTCMAACQRTDSMSDVSGPSPAAAVPGSSGLSSETPREGSAGVDSPGKPLPPIDFEYELLGEPVVGQPLEIRVTSGFQADLDALNVALSGNERMEVPAALARFRMARTAGSAPMTRTIRVTPLATGTTYLDVVLQADIGGRPQSRAVTIPIRVGDQTEQAAPDGTLSTDAEGQPIISLPAGEN